MKIEKEKERMEEIKREREISRVIRMGHLVNGKI